MKRVFVYGTLMRGERANGMLEDGEYKGDYVLEDYSTFDLGPFPGIKVEKGGKVFGELYEVPDSLIQKLDAYEGEGDLYERVFVTVRNEKTVDNVNVYVYLGDVYGRQRVRGRWGSISA